MKEEKTKNGYMNEDQKKILQTIRLRKQSMDDSDLLLKILNCGAENAVTKENRESVLHLAVKSFIAGAFEKSALDELTRILNFQPKINPHLRESSMGVTALELFDYLAPRRLKDLYHELDARSYLACAKNIQRARKKLINYDEEYAEEQIYNPTSTQERVEFLNDTQEKILQTIRIRKQSMNEIDSLLDILNTGSVNAVTPGNMDSVLHLAIKSFINGNIEEATIEEFNHILSYQPRINPMIRNYDKQMTALELFDHLAPQRIETLYHELDTKSYQMCAKRIQDVRNKLVTYQKTYTIEQSKEKQKTIGLFTDITYIKLKSLQYPLKKQRIQQHTR